MPSAFGQKAFEAAVKYKEGVSVGYRYYSTFEVKPAYEFGYRLSYSRFTYGDLKLNFTEFRDKLTTTLTVTNSGKGQESGASLPQRAGKVDKPACRVEGVCKNRLVKTWRIADLYFTLRAAGG